MPYCERRRNQVAVNLGKVLPDQEIERLLKSRLHRFESAQLVWDALVKAGSRGLTKEEIKRKAGLTNGQVNYAFGFIKDVLMEKYKQPLVCNMRTYRYSLPPEWFEVKDYVDGDAPGVEDHRHLLQPCR